MCKRIGRGCVADRVLGGAVSARRCGRGFRGNRGCRRFNIGTGGGVDVVLHDGVAVFVLVIEVDVADFFLRPQGGERFLGAEVRQAAFAVGGLQCGHVVSGLEGGGVFHALDNGGEGVGVFVEADAVEVTLRDRKSVV